MNVSNAGTVGYPVELGRKRAAQAPARNTFAEQMQQTAGGQRLVLHGRGDAGEGEESVGSWVNARTGSSVAVYKVKDFNEANPVCHVKVWDARGNMTEKMVNISQIDPQSSDPIEMYTYSCYLGSSGQDQDATLRFTSVHSYYQGEWGDDSFESMFRKSDWTHMVRDFMQMQYDAGNLKGYLEYKKFLEFLL